LLENAAATNGVLAESRSRPPKPIGESRAKAEKTMRTA